MMISQCVKNFVKNCGLFSSCRKMQEMFSVLDVRHGARYTDRKADSVEYHWQNLHQIMP